MKPPDEPQSSGIKRSSTGRNQRQACSETLQDNHLKRSHLHVLLEDKLFFAVCGSSCLCRYDQSELQVPSNKEHLLLFLYRH